MGNLVINTNKISTNVIPNIKNADTYIKNAKTYATSMYGLLPKDFSSRSTALNIKTEIEYLSSDIEKLLSFFQSKASSIDEIDFKNSNRLHSFVDTVNNIQNRNNSFMSINGIYYTEEGLSKELENIMSDDVFKSEVILAICINEQNKSDINKGTVAGFHQLESTQNNFYFTSTEEANKVYNENLKDFIALYNNKWKQGIVPQNEFLNGVKKFFDCQDAYVKYLESDTYYQEQIDTLKKENADCNRKISAYDNEYNDFTEISCLNGTQSKTEYYTALNKHNEYVEKTNGLKEKVNANSDLIAYYTEQLAYSNVEKLYNAERVNVINTKEYNNLSIEDAKAELEEFSICYPDDTNASANDAVAGRCEKVEDIISLGTEEDIKLVCLYSRNHTEKETKKFISAAVSPRINKVFAEQQAKLYESKGSIGRFAQGTGTAIYSGCEGIGNAITGINKMITSDDSYTFAGKNTIALGEIQNIEKCKALNYWYSGVQSAVAQSPGVALSFVPYVGKGLALGYSAAYSAGNTYVEDVNAGKDAKTARSVAIINAGVELGSSALLGAVPVEGALTKSAKSALYRTKNGFMSKFLNGTLDVALDSFSEVVEENIQDGLNIGIKNIAYGEHKKQSLSQIKDTTCVTAISTLLLRGFSSPFKRIYNTNINTSNELNLQNNLVTADNIVNNNNNFMFIQPNIDNSVNSVIDNVRNTTNPIPNNTLTNDVYSKVALRLNNLPKSLMGFALFGVPYTKNRFIYKNTNNIDGLNNNIKNNCLYHFTSEGNIDLILDSGYVKASNRSTSYGNEKSFFFNGIPEVGNYALNLDTVPLTATAVKIVPTDVALNSDSMKVRIGDDGAITWDGNFNFKDNVASAEKVYLALSKENGKYFYKEVSEDVYRNYNDNHPTNVDIFAKGNNKDIATSFAGNFLYDVYSKKVSNSVNKIKGTLSNRVNNLFIHNNAFNVVEHSVLDESSNYITIDSLNDNVNENNSSPLYPESFNPETSTNINNTAIKSDIKSAVFDSSKRSSNHPRIQEAINMAKRVATGTGGFVGAITSISLATTGIPGLVFAMPILGKSLKVIENATMGNYIKNSNFGVKKGKNFYVDTDGIKHKVDSINQVGFDTTGLKGLSLPKECKSIYFMANALNAFQQLKVYDANGNNQVYQIDSHAMTKRALKTAEKLGYIKIVQENNLGKTSFKVEKLLMGNLSVKDFFTPGKAQATKYQMLFELTGKKLSSTDLIEILGKDFSTYNAIFDVTVDENGNINSTFDPKKLNKYKKSLKTKEASAKNNGSKLGDVQFARNVVASPNIDEAHQTSIQSKNVIDTIDTQLNDDNFNNVEVSENIDISSEKIANTLEIEKIINDISTIKQKVPLLEINQVIDFLNNKNIDSKLKGKLCAELSKPQIDELLNIYGIKKLFELAEADWSGLSNIVKNLDNATLLEIFNDVSLPDSLKSEICGKLNNSQLEYIKNQLGLLKTLGLNPSSYELKQILTGVDNEILAILNDENVDSKLKGKLCGALSKTQVEALLNIYGINKLFELAKADWSGLSNIVKNLDNATLIETFNDVSLSDSLKSEICEKLDNSQMEYIKNELGLLKTLGLNPPSYTLNKILTGADNEILAILNDENVDSKLKGKLCGALSKTQVEALLNIYGINKLFELAKADWSGLSNIVKNLDNATLIETFNDVSLSDSLKSEICEKLDNSQLEYIKNELGLLKTLDFDPLSYKLSKILTGADNEILAILNDENVDSKSKGKLCGALSKTQVDALLNIYGINKLFELAKADWSGLSHIANSLDNTTLIEIFNDVSLPDSLKSEIGNNLYTDTLKYIKNELGLSEILNLNLPAFKLARILTDSEILDFLNNNKSKDFNHELMTSLSKDQKANLATYINSRSIEEIININTHFRDIAELLTEEHKVPVLNRILFSNLSKKEKVMYFNSFDLETRQKLIDFLSLEDKIYLSNIIYIPGLNIKIKNSIDEMFSNYKGKFGIDQGDLKDQFKLKVIDNSWLESIDDFYQYAFDKLMKDAEKELNKLKGSSEYDKYVNELKEQVTNFTTRVSKEGGEIKNKFQYNLIIDYLLDRGKIEIADKFCTTYAEFIYTDVYNRLFNKLKSKYGMNDVDAKKVLENVDYKTGVCSYTAPLNILFAFLIDNRLFQQEFETKTGIKLFNEDGSINASELLLDLYLFANTNTTVDSDGRGGRLYINNNGNYSVAENFDTENQFYFNKNNYTMINDYLNSYGINQKFVQVDCGGSAPINMEELKINMINYLSTGYKVQLSIRADKNEVNNFTLIAPEGANYGDVCTTSWNEDGGHAIFVTGVTNDSFIVSSWGKKFYIKLSDFINGNYDFEVYDYVDK